MHEN
jgi:CheY-like chemotaxis protein